MSHRTRIHYFLLGRFSTSFEKRAKVFPTHYQNQRRELNPPLPLRPALDTIDLRGNRALKTKSVTPTLPPPPPNTHWFISPYRLASPPPLHPPHNFTISFSARHPVCLSLFSPFLYHIRSSKIPSLCKLSHQRRGRKNVTEKGRVWLTRHGRQTGRQADMSIPSE